MTLLIDDAAHRAWLTAEGRRLLNFGQGARDRIGFGWLSEDGRLDNGDARDTRDQADDRDRGGDRDHGDDRDQGGNRAQELWITARMTYSFALGELLGHPGAAELADHGLAALQGAFRDRVNGGWVTSIDVADDGAVQVVDGTKGAYPHSFVILAAAAATVAKRPGARELLNEALAVFEQRFWEPQQGLCRESWNQDFTIEEPYRGVNSNMHAVEALLAASDATGEAKWRQMALAITRRVVRDFAQPMGWRLAEHYTPNWQPLLQYNADKAADPFRPFGVTVGHLFEWARLALHVRAAISGDEQVDAFEAVVGVDAPALLVGSGDSLLGIGALSSDWLLPAARELFDRAVADGWATDGFDGFVYTADWDGRPVVRQRMHWVAAEAIGAAAALFIATGDKKYAQWYETWWGDTRQRFIDLEDGSWWHETAPDGRPSATVWAGKPDIYHALQATLIPRLPLAPTLAAALAAGDLAS